jgi:hypothetical protein
MAYNFVFFKDHNHPDYVIVSDDNEPYQPDQMTRSWFRIPGESTIEDLIEKASKMNLYLLVKVFPKIVDHRTWSLADKMRIDFYLGSEEEE